MSPQNQAKDDYNFILYIPEILHHKYKVNYSHRVVLEFDVNPIKRLMGRLVNREPVSDLELDELSSSAWLSMDGKRSILDIIRIQSKKTGEDIHETTRRTVQFMRYIATRGWIKFKPAPKNPD
jgi:hypothetical protein